MVTVTPHQLHVLRRGAVQADVSVSRFVASWLELIVPSVERILVLAEKLDKAEEEVREGFQATAARAERVMESAVLPFLENQLDLIQQLAELQRDNRELRLRDPHANNMGVRSEQTKNKKGNTHGH